MMRDDKLSIAPTSEFITLELRDMDKSEPLECLKKYDEFSNHREGMPNLKAPLKMDDLLMADSQFVLVEGPPGIGKSTLCWELCRNWDTTKSLEGFQIVLHLKLRETRVQNATSLQEVFYHEDRRLCDSVVAEAYRCEGEGILMIFDGFDEMPARDDSSLIMRLISGRCLPKATCFVTSRPSTLHCEIIRKKNVRVEILGFTNKSKLQYAQSAFKSDPNLFSHFEKFISSNPVINSFMYIPLNCAIMVQVFKDIRRSRKLMPKTVTQLYTTLTLILIRRNMIEKGKSSRIPGSIKQLPEQVLGDLKKVGELAYKGLFNKEGIQLEFEDPDVAEGFQHLGLLVETKEMYVCEGAKTSYSFLHLSIQEFLAAWHVSCYPDTLIEKTASVVLSGSGFQSHFKAFILFLAGMVGCVKLPPQIFRNDTLQCLYEAQDPNSMHLLHQYSNRTICLHNPLIMHVFGYALVHAPVKWRASVSIPLDPLLSSLADHALPGVKIMGSIQSLELRVEPDASLKLELLPKCLQHSVFTINIIFLDSDYKARTTRSILRQFAVQRNRYADMYFDPRAMCKNDYELYRPLQKFLKLKKLELHFYKMTIKGMLELCKSIANHPTLEEIILTRDWNVPPFLEYSFGLLVKAALSCPSIKYLSLSGLLFQTLRSNITTNVRHLSLSVQPRYSLTSLWECLYCIANLCKLPSVKTLILLLHFQRVGIFCNFIAALNNALHSNPSIEELRGSLSIFPSIQHSTMSHALQKHPDILQLNLRKSKSLGDVSTSAVDEVWFLRNPLQRSSSCPDLLEMHSLHRIHPLLYNFLLESNCCDFYYSHCTHRTGYTYICNRIIF